MPANYFVGTVSRSSTLTFVGTGSSAVFTRSRAADFTTSRYSSYTRKIYRNAIEGSSAIFTTTYVGDYIGDFTKYRYSAYAGNYSRDFIGDYSRSFTRSRASSFSRDFIGNYTRSVDKTFIGDYSREFIGESTRVSSYTRTLSGGSGEGPTYTATASDADYGLIVYGPDGVTEIINPQTRVINIAYYANVSVSGNSSTTVTIDDVGDPTKVMVSFVTPQRGMTLSASGNTLTVTNTFSYNRNPTILAIRL